MTLTFKMVPDGIISGIVFDEAGEPVRQAQVRAERVRVAGANEGLRQNGSAGTAMTDDRGRYEISPLTPGEYKLRVDARPWYATGAGRNVPLGGPTPTPPSPDPSLDVVYAETWFPAAADEASAETIRLSGGEERQADLHLTPVPSIHLRIPRADPPPDPNSGVQRGSSPPFVVRDGGAGGVMQTMTTSPNGTEWDIGGLGTGDLPGQAGWQLREFQRAGGEWAGDVADYDRRGFARDDQPGSGDADDPGDRDGGRSGPAGGCGRLRSSTR